MQGEERKRVQQYFLRSTERQNKLRFASELLERAADERGRQTAASVEVQPGILERARLFWANTSLLARFASTFATIVIVAGIALLALSDKPTYRTYARIDLGISSSERSVGSETKSVRLEPGSPGIRIQLTLPDQIPQSKSYRVELLDEQRSARNLKIDEQTDRTLVVTVPADQIRRGRYVIHLHAVNLEGVEQRIRGSYQFNVE